MNGRSALLTSPAVAQGIYYLTTGVWPVVSIGSFEAISGNKTDEWMVKTFGGLIAVVGGAILLGSHTPTQPEIKALAIGAALCLGIADINYVARGRISRVYLLDAIVEGCLIGLWLKHDRR